ncbi:hypothetical protein XELAEV_18006668mg [Xenopus laevis]|uniref:Uncharacterized protein n=1 Tax=Xenopus laevis TaxID=8355 RepID=A0A974DZ90_XENLA|nr:hypothetical protein XELAEV_18006668mg [Xenopus laevis]
MVNIHQFPNVPKQIQFNIFPAVPYVPLYLPFPLYSSLPITVCIRQCYVQGLCYYWYKSSIHRAIGPYFDCSNIFGGSNVDKMWVTTFCKSLVNHGDGEIPLSKTNNYQTW